MTVAAVVQLRSESAGDPSARRQFRHRRREPRLNPNPQLSAEVRAKYMEPIIPSTMHALTLTRYDWHLYGLVSARDMEGYASHCETGVPWFITLGRFVVTLAPPSKSDPVHMQRTIPKYLRKKARLIEPKPTIAELDRATLRAKYADIARQYLAGGGRRMFHG